jgi:DNA-binding transcriptional regulator YiaG
MTKSEKRLIGAAREAVAIARGQKKPARLKVPPEIDVKAIRTKLSMSQKDFAAEFGFTYDQLKAWEQKRIAMDYLERTGQAVKFKEVQRAAAMAIVAAWQAGVRHRIKLARVAIKAVEPKAEPYLNPKLFQRRS